MFSNILSSTKALTLFPLSKLPSIHNCELNNSSSLYIILVCHILLQEQELEKTIKQPIKHNTHCVKRRVKVMGWQRFIFHQVILQ